MVILLFDILYIFSLFTYILYEIFVELSIFILGKRENFGENLGESENFRRIFWDNRGQSWEKVKFF